MLPHSARQPVQVGKLPLSPVWKENVRRMINDLVSLLTASSSPLLSQFHVSPRKRSSVQRSTFLSGAYLYLDLSSFKASLLEGEVLRDL